MLPCDAPIGGGPTLGRLAGGGPGRKIGDALGNEAGVGTGGVEEGKGGAAKGGGRGPDALGTVGGAPGGRLICRFCMLSDNEFGVFW